MYASSIITTITITTAATATISLCLTKSFISLQNRTFGHKCNQLIVQSTVRASKGNLINQDQQNIS